MTSTTHQPTRPCKVCKRTLPLDRFYASGHGNGRRHTCTRCINVELDQERRARGAHKRHPRYNARGHVWCNRCQHYLTADQFKRHPSRPGTCWSYCKPCVIQIDRERYRRKVSTIEGATQVLEARYKRKKRAQAKAIRDRKEYVIYVIDQLRLRGFTRAEISRLTGVSQPTLAKWADPKDKTRILEAGERRLEIVFRETVSLPRIGYQNGRRLPHPEYARIHALTHDDVQAVYLRNAWRKANGEKGRTA